jgi:hypothetical protein
MAYGPGRKFKKVPPKGKKPIRPVIRQPFQPNEYGDGLFDEGAWEAFYEQANPANLPKNVYKQLGISLGAAAKARYSTAPLREEALDIEATEKEIQDLPGALGAGVSLNVKDWLDDPAKQIDKTVGSWWDSVFSWEDLTANAEQNFIWKPLLNGENSATGSLALVEQDPTTGVVTGRGVQLKVDLGSEVNADFYKTIASDYMKWANVIGSRDDRLEAYRNIQVDMLTAIDQQLDSTRFAALATSTDPRLRAFHAKWQKLRDEVLRVEDVVDPLSASGAAIKVAGYEDVSGVVTPGEAIKRRKWDSLNPRGKKIEKAFGDALKDVKILGRTVGAESVAGVGALVTPFVPEPLVVGGAAAYGALNPEIAPLLSKRRSLVAEQAHMINIADDAWQEVLRNGPAFLQAQLQAGSSAEADRLLTWMRLANFRETQSAAYDFLEAVDGKSFFRTFIWNGGLGKMARLIPGVAEHTGLSPYFKYLAPGDYVKTALTKIKYFGLTDTFNEVKSLWQPFQAAAAFIEKTPILARPLEALSLGLLGSGNFAYSTFGNAWQGTALFDKTVLLKAKDFSETALGLVSGKINIGGTLVKVDDWGVLEAITKLAKSTDAAGNALLDASELKLLFDQSVSSGIKRAILDFNGSTAANLGRDAANVLKGLENPAYQHFLDMLSSAEGDRLRDLLRQYEIMDAAGNIDATRFAAFWGDVQGAHLNNKFIGFVTSAGRRLDHYQSLIFQRIYKVPGIGPLIKQLRGGWIQQAMMNPRAAALAARTWLTASAASLGARLGTSAAANALRVVGSAIVKVLRVAIGAAGEIFGGPLGQILLAAISWVVGKIVGKIWDLIKGPAKKGSSFIYKLTPFHWALFTDYGFLGTGEDFKTLSCLGCLGCGGLPLLILPLFVIVVIGGANMNFVEDFTAASPDITVSKVITVPSSGEIALGGTQTITYQLQVNNHSSKTAAGVTLTDTYQAASGVSVVTCSGGPVAVGGVLTWGIGTLTAHEVKTYTCQMNVVASADKFITNSAAVAATINGQNVSNSTTATLKVGNPAVVAPCGYPAGSHSLSASCSWSGHARPAVDINYSAGTSLKALIAGTATRCVITTGEKQMSDSYGIYVDVVGAGFKTRYGHLQAEPGEVNGQGCRLLGPVAVGDTIGRVGLTGKTTGVHVHYEIFKSGTITCPESYLSFTAPECH